MRARARDTIETNDLCRIMIMKVNCLNISQPFLFEMLNFNGKTRQRLNMWDDLIIYFEPLVGAINV